MSEQNKKLVRNLIYSVNCGFLTMPISGSGLMPIT